MAARDVFDERRIDILVYNTGMIHRADSTYFGEADWDDVIDVNLKTVFFTSQAFAKAAFARKTTGRIANIASLFSCQGESGCSPIPPQHRRCLNHQIDGQ
jgi:2-deoxy-D-gluconate 3-dehydrogenase